MKCQLVNKNYKNDFAKSLINERINKLKLNFSFDELEKGELSDYSNLENIYEGINLLENTLINKKEILIVVDCDCDGYTSAAMMYQYLKYTFGYEATIILHSAKQHGLADIIDICLDKYSNYGLVICPDSSTNDFEYHEQLGELGISVLVIDHHELIDGVTISDNACIINNQLSHNYLNKDLTGAGLVYQFLRAFDNKLGIDNAENLVDLAALGIIADMASVLSLENKYIINKGLNNIKNFFFKSLIEAQSFSMKGEVNPTTIAFYIVPLINASIRVATQEEKERVFLSFIDGEKDIVSKKRGAKGALEKQAIEAIRESKNAKNKQKKIKESAVEDLIISQIEKEELLSNKILFICLDENSSLFPSTLNGIICMQLAAKFKRPTLVGRINEKGEIKGSGRGLNDSALKDFKNFLFELNIFEELAGHPNAFGFSIKKKNVEKFLTMANHQLQEYNFNENILDINFKLDFEEESELIKTLIFDLDNFKSYWGQKNTEPTIYMENIKVNQSNIDIVGKNKDTLRINKNGITFIMFFAKNIIDKFLEHKNMILEIAGNAAINEWNSIITPQIIIKDFKITKDLEF